MAKSLNYGQVLAGVLLDKKKKKYKIPSKYSKDGVSIKTTPNQQILAAVAVAALIAVLIK